MSNYDKQNIGAIISGEGDWFGAFLIRLIAKADGSNRRKLAREFPEEVHAVNCFQYGKEAANAQRQNDLFMQGN